MEPTCYYELCIGQSVLNAFDTIGDALESIGAGELLEQATAELKPEHRSEYVFGWDGKRYTLWKEKNETD